MEITITCRSYDELTQFAETLLGRTGAVRTAAPVQGGTPAVPAVPNVPVMSNAPGAPAAPTAPAAPNTPAAYAASTPGQNAAVPTTAASYTLDDIQKAAHVLMDYGKQTELKQLLTCFEVASLPELPAARYGEFATALRTMGAPI